MTIGDDQRFVREASEQRRTARAWSERWTDIAWLRQRVTELERWHANQHSWHIDNDDPERLRICRGEHGPDDGCEWESYTRSTEEAPTDDTTAD